jgi:FixJ family two-component response regulator
MNPPARVLVVDDDMLMRDVLQRLLANAGMSVETYASGSELLELADLRAPAVLLLDVKMPAMSGLELHARLRERGTALPIVFLTGASNVAMAVSAMRHGAVDFIEKPFDSAELVARIAYAYTRHLERIGPHGPVMEAAAEHRVRLASLTPREREVLDLMVTGRSSKTMARELGGSFRTIEIHRGRVMSKMAVASLAALVRMTLEAGARR